ncbi:TPA: hypothetical protein KDY89_004923 [Vibrio parahaemolyticus]|nr:hypothetical protein [Vibrio parahaemolyticus]
MTPAQKFILNISKLSKPLTYLSVFTLAWFIFGLMFLPDFYANISTASPLARFGLYGLALYAPVIKIANLIVPPISKPDDSKLEA